MKPLPEYVQRAFPREPGDLPARPWWYKSLYGYCGGGAPCFRRNDDPHTTASTVEQVAFYDAAHPLPHPGYRAGQVWAAEDGESITILRAKSTRVLASADSPDVLPPGEFAQDYPYLMADPACPHLAPWSPCEVKP